MAGKSGFAMKNYTQMNDEVEQIDGELGEMLAKARKDIEALEWDTKKVALPKHQRDAEVSRIKSVLDSARSVHQNFKVELRDLDRESLSQYEPKAKAHMNTIEELSRGLEFAKQQLEKRELMGDRAEQEAKNVSNMGAMEIIQEAEKTQQDDLKVVVRMQQMVENSEEIGVDTNIKLKLQTEQLGGIQVDVYSINETMNRANKLANDIGKRLMTDRLIACMLLTLLFLIFIIIVMKSFGYGTETIDGQVIKIDCNLDITKTRKECLEMAAAMAAGGKRSLAESGRHVSLGRLAEG